MHTIDKSAFACFNSKTALTTIELLKLGLESVDRCYVEIDKAHEKAIKSL